MRIRKIPLYAEFEEVDGSQSSCTNKVPPRASQEPHVPLLYFAHTPDTYRQEVEGKRLWRRTHLLEGRDSFFFLDFFLSLRLSLTTDVLPSQKYLCVIFFFFALSFLSISFFFLRLRLCDSHEDISLFISSNETSNSNPFIKDLIK